MRDLAAVGALANPVRLRLYDAVCEAGPLTRQEAAEATGIGRPLAAYHLEQLAKCGLLGVEHRRAGTGRPAKVYRRAEREFVLRAPPRDYRLLAEVLAEAADPAAAAQAARRTGRRRGDDAVGIVELLRVHGYEPVEAEPGVLRLRNCPFDAVAKACPQLICGVSLAFVEGLVEGRAQAQAAPRPGMCCVEVRL
jgi:predicted ArsR family transcriptional regulator